MKGYRRVLSGVVLMLEPPREELDDEGSDEDEEGQAVKMPYFVCDETREAHPLAANAVGQTLQTKFLGAHVEIVAAWTDDNLTVHQYTSLHSGRVEIVRGEDCDSGGAADQRSLERGQTTDHHDRRPGVPGRAAAPP